MDTGYRSSRPSVNKPDHLQGLRHVSLQARGANTSECWSPCFSASKECDRRQKQGRHSRGAMRRITNEQRTPMEMPDCHSLCIKEEH
eukprot:1142603-Pelagomonas_calceolata.AAC.2